MINYFKRLYCNLRLKINEIKWFIQRGKRGYADCDWWSLDTYICQVMIDAMEDLMYRGCHVGCYGGKKGLEGMNDPEARRIHNLYRRMKRFFELHQMFMDDWHLYDNKELRRQYKASGLLLIRNFGNLWD